MAEQIVRELVDGEWTTTFEISGAVPAGTVAIASVDLTSGQIKTLTASPVEMVAAPGSGTMVNLLSAVFSYHAGATPYTPVAGSFLVITATPAEPFGGTFMIEVPTAGLIDSATDLLSIAAVDYLSLIPRGISPAGYNNAAVVVTNDRPGEHTDGDGTLTVSLVYAVTPI